MTEQLNIAYIQPNIEWHNIEKNLKKYDSCINKIEGADIIALPEMFATGFTNEINGLAQTMNGQIVGWIKQKAIEKKALIIGSQLITHNNKTYNRLLAAFPDGELKTYDKHHLFRMGLENDTITAGNEILIFNYKGWNIRPIVCYDLRFPVWLRNTNNAYDLLICVTNWPTSRVLSYNVLLQARAIENQCYVVGVNRIGTDGLNIEYPGNSCIINPYGEIIDILPSNVEGYGQSYISLDMLKTHREKFPAFLDADQFTINNKQ